MDVLVFENSNYKITISSPSIEYAWKRFSRRVKDNAYSYCDYISSQEGVLSVLLCSEQGTELMLQNTGQLAKFWPNLPPVLFETCEYQFAVELFDLAKIINERQKPHVCHQIKDIKNTFKFYSNSEHSGILVGNIDFLNSPGKFDFNFQYINQQGTICKQNLQLYVASPKLDTKNDLGPIISLINKEYENYIFNYLTLTFSSFAIEKTKKNNKIIWFSIFKGVVDDYIKNVKYIMSRPNNKASRKAFYSRPDRIRKWSCQEAERFKNWGYDADKHLYREERIENTFNTKENRFVKYSLWIVGKKFYKVFGEISSLYKDLDKEEQHELDRYNRTFKQLKSSSFFNKIGIFEGFRQESAILQQRTGYSQIYKYWLMLKSGLDLIDGSTDIGMKKIWELYEIWCFLVMKQLVARVLNIDLNNPEEVRSYVHEDKKQVINSFENTEMFHKIEFTNKENHDIICLEYQRTYNRKSRFTKTLTTEQRPDIVLTITKPDGFVLTYLYDAKYRVQDDVNDADFDDGVDVDIADYPLPDAINQMHRYRDAIYYSMSNDIRPDAKEIIGGYILFPGRTSGDGIKERYFYKSIETVNIGAFPLLPAESEDSSDIIQCKLLYEHLNHILKEPTVHGHIYGSIPQKGLFYSEIDTLGSDNRNAYIGYVGVKEENIIDFEQHCARYYKLDKLPDINLLDTRYLVPMVKGFVDGFYKVIGIKINDGKLVLKLGEFLSLGETKVNFYEKIRPTELISLNQIANLYQDIMGN